MSTKHILVGNSFASLFAAEAIRAVERDSSITIIGEENDRLYTRALIHEYLANMISTDKIYLREENYYNRMNIKWLSGRKATKLDAKKQEIIIENEPHKYDKLFLGVGGAPFIPPGMNGLDKFPNQVHTFTKLEDAKQIADKCKEANNVIVLGAGLIGMQAAEALAHIGKNVTVVELADYVLPMVSDKIASSMIQQQMEEEGVSFCLSQSVDELIGKEGKLTSVKLRSGEELDADLFVVAVGVRPNIEWLRDTELTIDRGIIVDETAKTSLDNIYAGGDCAQGQEIISGSRMVLATIPIAAEQGTVAGYNMAGSHVTYKGGIPLNALQFGRLQIISYGYVKEKEGQEVISELDKDACVYKKLILEDNRLTGALFLRAIDRVGLFRYLIEEKIDVSEFKDQLLKPDFGPASLPTYIREQLFGQRQTRIKT